MFDKNGSKWSITVNNGSYQISQKQPKIALKISISANGCLTHSKRWEVFRFLDAVQVFVVHVSCRIFTSNSSLWSGQILSYKKEGNISKRSTYLWVQLYILHETCTTSKHIYPVHETWEFLGDFVPEKKKLPRNRSTSLPPTTQITNILLVNDENSSINIYNKFPYFPSTQSNTTHMYVFLIIFLIR